MRRRDLSISEAYLYIYAILQNNACETIEKAKGGSCIANCGDCKDYMVYIYIYTWHS